MSEVGTCEVDGEVGILCIDNPPVNALGIATRRALDGGLRGLFRDDAVKAIVLMCAGRTFFAGADISEFGQPIREPGLLDVLALIENAPKPIIAAIHGTALGGGYELALVCHHRIAVPSSKVGLPEVALGLLPGAGGTQRLPRIVGIESALEIITGGKPIAAPVACRLGMLDALVGEGRLREDAIAYARKVVADNVPLVRVRDRQDKIASARGKSDLYSNFLEKNARDFRGFKAPFNIVKAIEAAAELPFDQSIARERELFLELVSSTQSAAQRYYFFAEREAAKIPDLPKSTATMPIASAGVIGAGTMGGGIAMNFLNVGIPVTLVETSESALDHGIRVIRRNYEASAAKGRMTSDEVEQRMGLIRPELALDALSEVDLVIEAVFEEMAIKKGIFARLDEIAKPGAILASNTSFLDIDEIAAVTARPESVVGLHFFSPANVMRLLEVVRGARTSNEVLATAMSLARMIGKVPVLAGVCHGFIANRVMAVRGEAANALILHGATPQEVDAALWDYGFAMGPFQMIDLVGLDVVGRGETERTVRSDLVALGRLGQKSGGGFYDYDDRRKATPSPAAAKVIAAFAAFNGVSDDEQLTREQIVARLLYPVVNEGAKVIEEGIAIRASDIDVACILGYNWPVYTGGPMFWADTVGLSTIVAGLESMGIEPAALLRDKATSNTCFTR